MHFILTRQPKKEISFWNLISGRLTVAAGCIALLMADLSEFLFTFGLF